MVDMNGIPSFHQGLMDVRKKRIRLKDDDFFYNYRFMKKEEDGRFKANYRVRRFSHKFAQLPFFPV